MERDPSVGIGLRQGRVFVIPKWSPGRGSYIDKGPVIIVDSTVPLAIGEAVLESLRSFSWDNSCKLPDWNTYPSFVLEAGGFASWSEYERGLRDCYIFVENDQYHIYTELPHIFLPLDASADVIGNAVLQALGTSVEKEVKKSCRRRTKQS